MDDRKKHIIVIICIAVLTLTVITCVNKGVGYYLRHVLLVDQHYSYYANENVTEEIDDPGSPLHGKTMIVSRESLHEGWEKGPLPEVYIQRILSVIDISLLGVGVLAYLIFVSCEKHAKRKTKLLFCILGCFILFSAIVVYSIYFSSN